MISPQICVSPISYTSDTPRDARKYAAHMMPEELNELYMQPPVMDELCLPATFPLKRQNSEGEARDHPYYKQAIPQADGLYHCPWEGDSSCNHKPEKLKCNYE